MKSNREKTRRVCGFYYSFEKYKRITTRKRADISISLLEKLHPSRNSRNIANSGTSNPWDRDRRLRYQLRFTGSQIENQSGGQTSGIMSLEENVSLTKRVDLGERRSSELTPRRGLRHSGPGVNQSFVPASLRVNRFRCSICLQRLHVHAWNTLVRLTVVYRVS